MLKVVNNQYCILPFHTEGFGPKLFSVKAFKDTETSENESNGIDFSLRLLPLGESYPAIYCLMTTQSH